MNIKKRLIINNIINIVVPIIITLFVALLFINISYRLYNREIKYDKFENIALLKSQLAKISEDIVKEKFETSELSKFQDYLENTLSKYKGKYIIIKGENTSVAASKDISAFDAQNCINEINDNHLQPMLSINKVSYIYEISSVKYKDGGVLNVLILVPTDGDFNIIKQFILVLIITFILSSVIVNTTSSYF